MINEKIINECKQNNRLAQRKVYDFLSRKLYYTCQRYLSQEDEIEDTVTESFIIIFNKLHQLKEPKAFEGWARRIAINNCLKKLQKSVSFTVYLDDITSEPEHPELASDEIEGEQLLSLLDHLPKG